MNTSGSNIDAVDPDIGDLEDFLKRLVDSKALHMELKSWLEERLSTKVFDEPFKLEELYQFDHALEGTSFSQVLRMPSVLNSDPSLVAEACLAVEDFLYSAAQGLWSTFWHNENNNFPFFVAGTHKINGPHGGPYCAALVERSDEKGDDMLWEHIYEFVLVGDDIDDGALYGSFPSSTQVSQAVFYALQLLLSKKLSQLRSHTTSNQNVLTAFVLLVHFQGGSVVKVKGDVSKLETTNAQVYHSAATWVQQYANLTVSAIDKVWNKFGSVNWHDVGALQMVLATFHCMEQCRAPKTSITELSAQHSFRLLQRAEQRRLEINGSGNNPVAAASVSEIQEEIEEIQEVDSGSTTKLLTFLKIEPGTVLWLEESHEKKGFEVHEDLSDSTHSIYTAVALDDESKELLNVYVGAHPGQLEPSWEDMGTWYQVQRQARVLKVMKQRTLSSKYIHTLVHSGELLHPGLCTKQSLKGRCDHPWCGVPVLITSPVGESLQRIFSRDGILPPMELLKCCHDCLSALRSAQLVGIQHANISPDHVVRVKEASCDSYYVLVDWGHAILEEKDSPGTNLKFSSSDALQEGRTCPASDIESLIYVLFYLCGGILPQFDSIESALQWRVRAWTRRAIQQVLGEASIVLKAFADYVDNLCATPYSVDYDIWLRRLSRVLGREGSSSLQHD
ncbi:hypothetical protein GOP47_0009414 [Adiantum capillus-veneris]|uniref:Protein kinase domain-containing protein n=1 Tax=Adiantum capillus-veneris TaxID=13818 RepID=A0A9D4ZH58_ADICA|nr:hypothetical protein GOP47_0009414 [Adiantum capillus-veneris]